jgi:hypothetical protein
MDDEVLEQKIEELIEEKVEKISEGEDPKSSLGKLIEKKVEQKIEREDEETVLPEKTTRRNFMKMLGLGAGAVGLSSAGASWFSVNNNAGGGGSQTLSEVLSKGNDVNGKDIVDGGTTIWDTNNQQIPSNSVEITGLEAELWNNYELQKNGTDGQGIINFKTG